MSAFDWTGYLTLAEELVTRRDDESAQRSAISRAYYAALGRASELLRAEGKTVSPLRTHATIWRAFTHSPDTRRAEVGLQLDRLRQDRNRADYDRVFDGDLSSAAHDAVARARRLLQTLDDVVASPAED